MRYMLVFKLTVEKLHARIGVISDHIRQSGDEVHAGLQTVVSGACCNLWLREAIQLMNTIPKLPSFLSRFLLSASAQWKTISCCVRLSGEIKLDSCTIHMGFRLSYHSISGTLTQLCHNTKTPNSYNTTTSLYLRTIGWTGPTGHWEQFCGMNQKCCHMKLKTLCRDIRCISNKMLLATHG
mgnify:CR=1 FL=1